MLSLGTQGQAASDVQVQAVHEEEEEASSILLTPQGFLTVSYQKKRVDGDRRTAGSAIIA